MTVDLTLLTDDELLTKMDAVTEEVTRLSGAEKNLDAIFLRCDQLLTEYERRFVSGVSKFTVVEKSEVERGGVSGVSKFTVVEKATK